MLENEITEKIIGCAIEVHKALGPGLLEKTYQECLFYELGKQGLKARKEVALPVSCKEISLDMGYRIDLIVEEKVIVEIKAVDSINDIHLAQVLTYLKMSGLKVGLLSVFLKKMRILSFVLMKNDFTPTLIQKSLKHTPALKQNDA